MSDVKGKLFKFEFDNEYDKSFSILFSFSLIIILGVRFPSFSFSLYLFSSKFTLFESVLISNFFLIVFIGFFKISTFSFISFFVLRSITLLGIKLFVIAEKGEEEEDDDNVGPFEISVTGFTFTFFC